jgi:hypothetical protein
MIISRKTALISAASAMLLFSGCQKTSSDKKKNAPEASLSFGSLADISSVLPRHIRHGDPTTEAGPQNFKSEFNALVYMAFNKDLKLVSSVQYFAASGAVNLKPDVEYAAVKAQATACIRLLNLSTLDVLPKCPGAIKATDINDLTFRAPSNILITTRHASLKFGPEPVVISDRTLRSGVKAMPNKSFYDAKVYAGGLDGRDLVYLRNYYTKKGDSAPDEQGVGDTAIGTDKLWYGLNFFMTIDQANNLLPLPMIVDPDGGNMGGNP